MENVCIDCGEVFTPPERFPNVPRCRPCWKRHVSDKSSAMVPAQQYADVLRQLKVAQGRVRELETNLRTTDELKVNLRRLTYLCHPDKHGGSEVATEATKWLVDLRSRLEVQT